MNQVSRIGKGIALVLVVCGANSYAAERAVGPQASTFATRAVNAVGSLFASTNDGDGTGTNCSSIALDADENAFVLGEVGRAEDTFSAVSDRITELLRLRQYTVAESLLKSTISRYPENPRSRAWLLNSLGYVYKCSGDYDRAVTHYQMAIDTAGPLLQSNDMSQLAPLSNLMSLYLQYGQNGKAERLRHKLETTAPRWRTADHEVTARIYCLFAILETRLRNFKEAEPLLLKADELLPTLKPARDSDHIAVLNNLAMVYRLTGRDEQALEAARRANDIANQNSGGATDAAHHALARVNLALAEQQTGHVEEAKQHFEQSMAIARTASARADPTMVEVLAVGAQFLQKVGLTREAKKMIKNAYQIRDAIARNTSLGTTVDYQSFR